jgi:TPR repeat protein
MPDAAGPAAGAPAKGGDATVLRTAVAAAPRTKATELEFWRSIKDGNDPADFELYLEQFPSGIYAALAKRKIARLQGLASGGQEQEKRENEEAAQREAEARQKLAEEKAAMEAALARREAEFQRREAELSQREAQVPKRSSLVPVLSVIAVAVAGFGLWQAFKPDPMAERVAELTRLLDESKQREAELVQSRQREAELARELDLMRQREADAKKSGDVTKQREIAEQVAQREAEARKQAELTRQREAEAKRQAEAAEQRRIEIARLAAESPAEPVKPVEEKAVEPTRLAIVTPPSTPLPDAPASIESMLQKAIALEGEGKNKEAARLLGQAVREGKGQAAGQAAKRLGDLLQKGVPGVPRDYGEALRYYEIARLNGVDVPVVKPR